MTEQEEYQEYLDYIEYQKYLSAQARPKSDIAGGVETGARSMLEGATAGLSEPVLSGVNAVVGTGIDAAMGAGPANWEAIKQAYADDVERRKRLKAEHSTVSAAAGLAGAVLPSPINIGSKIAKGAEALANAPKILRGAGLIKGAVRGAISGAAGGAGYETARQLAERPTGFIDSESAAGDVFSAAKFGGALGGGIGGALQLPSAILSVKSGAKKLLSSKLGVSEPSINAYLQNPERIRAAKGMEELYAEVQDAIAPMVRAVEEGKIDAGKAKEALDSAKKFTLENLKQQKFDAARASDQADTILKAAVERSRLQTAPEVVRGVEQLKDIVSEGSSKAWGVLEKSKKTFPTKVLKGELTKTINSLKVGGKGGGAVSESDAAALRSLELMRERVDKLPQSLTMGQLKQIVQGLDKDIKWRDGAGAFMDAASRQKLDIRRGVDAYMKRHVPEYEKAMQGVAKDTALLGEVSKKAGTEPQALAALAGAQSAMKTPQTRTIQALGKRLGKDFVRPVMEDAQPEFAAAAQARGRVGGMEGPNWLSQRAQKAVAGESARLTEAEKRLAAASEEMAPFAPLAPKGDGGFSSTQARLKAALGDRSIETRRMFEQLSKKTGKDFVQAIDDLRVKEAFEKGDVHGSRNVNLWAALFGGIVGAPLGGLTGAGVGVGMGAAVGKYMDKYGPQTAKAILDLAIKAKGLPSAKDILAWPIPKAARADLAKELGEVFTPEVMEQMGKNVRALPGMVKRGAEEAEKRVAENEQSRDRMPAAKRKARLKALEE